MGKRIKKSLSSEEIIRSINELALGTVAGVAGAFTLGAMGLDAIRKMNKNKQKMDQGAPVFYTQIIEH